MNAAFIGRNLSIICLFFLLQGCSPPKEIINVGLSSRPYTAFIQLANKDVFFDTRKLSLHELPSPTETMQAFQARKIDVAFVSIDQVITLAIQNVDFKVISVVDQSDGGLALLTQKDIKNVAMLNGKKIGFEHLSEGALLFKEISEMHPAVFQNIVQVEVRQNKVQDKFESGQVDAIIVNSPIKEYLLSAGAIELFNSKQMPHPIIHFIIARTEIIDRNHGDLVNLLTGFYKSKVYFNLNYEITSALLRKYLRISQSQLEKGLNDYSFINKKQALVNLSGAPSTIELALQDMNKYMFEHGMVSKENIDFNGFIDTSLLKGIIND